MLHSLSFEMLKPHLTRTQWNDFYQPPRVAFTQHIMNLFGKDVFGWFILYLKGINEKDTDV